MRVNTVRKTDGKLAIVVQGDKMENKRYATVDVTFFRALDHALQRTTIWVSKAEWESINTVDYLDFDSTGKLSADFDAHGAAVCAKMQGLLTRAPLSKVTF